MLICTKSNSQLIPYFQTQKESVKMEKVIHNSTQICGDMDGVNKVHIHDSNDIVDHFFDSVEDANNYLNQNAFYIDGAFLESQTISVIAY